MQRRGFKPPSSLVLKDLAHRRTGTLDVMASGLPGAVEQIKSAFEALLLALGESGLVQTLTTVIGRVTEVIRQIAAADPWVHRLITGVLMAGPALL